MDCVQCCVSRGAIAVCETSSQSDAPTPESGERALHGLADGMLAVSLRSSWCACRVADAEDEYLAVFNARLLWVRFVERNRNDVVSCILRLLATNRLLLRSGVWAKGMQTHVSLTASLGKQPGQAAVLLRLKLCLNL